MKYAYKLTPVSRYDIAGLESWLEDMATQGLFLKTFRPLFCSFAKGDPKPTRYRLEPQRRTLVDRPSQSMLDLYQEFGWTLVDTANDAMLIFSTQDPRAPELHSDPTIQQEQWHKLYKSERRGFWFDLLLIPPLAAMLLWLLGRETPVLALLTTAFLPIVLFLCFHLATLPGRWLDIRKLSRIARQLKEGVPLDHRAAYPRRRPQAVISFLAYVILLAAITVCQYILPFTGGGPGPLDQMTDFAPLSLEVLEGEDVQPSHYMGGGVDYSNFCDRERYLLCWDQWRVVQSGTCGPDSLWPRMEIDWYAPLLSSLAPALAKEQLGRYQILDADIWWAAPPEDMVLWTVEEFQTEGVDYLAVARREDGFQIAAVAAQGKTAVVRYTGHGDLRTHIDEIIAMVNP